MNWYFGCGSIFRSADQYYLDKDLNCCIAAVVLWPDDDKESWLTLYAVAIITFIFPWPLRVVYVHLPNPNGSAPFSTILDVQLFVMNVTVPPD